MAEDEDMDLEDDDLDLGDDDLDLGDDSGDDDAGDDFAGELDDMMGDDELGGDDDSGGGDDSELDSFFEDLSSIEDMDEGPSEGPDDSDDIAAPEVDVAKEPVEKPAPVKAKKDTTKKKGGKLKIILPLLILILLGGAGGYYYFFMKDAMVIEEAIIPETPPVRQVPIQGEKIPERRIELKPELPPPSPPPQEKPKPPQKQYLIQVATCSYDACKENFINSLRQDGEPVFQKSSSQKYDFIELISRQIFSFQEGDSIVKEINRKNKMAGNASLKNQSNGYRISMGVFPALDTAKEVKFHVEKLIPKQQVLFNLEHVRKKYSTIKIFAGPYDSRLEAKKVLGELRSKTKYKGAFLVIF